jgi:hypothetical protein
VGAIACGDHHVGVVCTAQCRGALVKFRCRTRQGASHHLAHFGIALYFPTLYEVYILSSLKSKELNNKLFCTVHVECCAQSVMI